MNTMQNKNYYQPRAIEKAIKEGANQFPAVIVTGPRQTGKSTLLKNIFPKHSYVSLDDPLIRRQAQEDPNLFLESYPAPLIIDEIQYAPEILSYLKIQIDENRHACGQFILTGSQIFPMMQGVTESLAGRIVIYELLGFSFKELPGSIKEYSVSQTFDLIYQGFYPEVCVHKVDANLFYRSYLQTYLERDLRHMRSVHDLSLFQHFLELLFARVGQLLNLNEIAKECGINQGTAKQWLSLLEMTRIVYVLRPYYKNITKRTVKSPKIYITDTGLLCHLLHFPSAESVQNSPMAGHIFENFIVIEWLKQKFNFYQNCELFFYRDSNGNEVDLIKDEGNEKKALEIKLTKTPKKEHGKILHKLKETIGYKNGLLINNSSNRSKLFEDVSLTSWWDMF